MPRPPKTIAVAALLLLLSSMLGRPAPCIGALSPERGQAVEQNAPALIFTRFADAAQLIPAKADCEWPAQTRYDPVIPPLAATAGPQSNGAALAHRLVNSLNDTRTVTAQPRGPPAA